MMAWRLDSRHHEPRTEDPWFLQVRLELLIQAGRWLEVTTGCLLLLGERSATCGRGIREPHGNQGSIHLAQGLRIPSDVGYDFGSHMLRLGHDEGLAF